MLKKDVYIILSYSISIMPALLKGALFTIKLFLLTLVCSLPLGLILGLGRTCRFKPLNRLIEFYDWIMRGTPLLLQIIFVFYGLPVVNIVFPRFEAAAIALILNYAAYFAEIFRGGFPSIPKGQYESAYVLCLTPGETVRKIIIPQVVKIVLPSIGNEVINLIKDSSLVYVIGLGDLLRAGDIAATRDVTLVPLILVGAIYLVLTGVASFGLKKVENHYATWKL